jgi:hypothetical protein
MLPGPGTPPGMERDAKGKPIALSERLPEDRHRAKEATAKQTKKKA